MPWTETYYRGWNIYWHRREHRMYAKKPGLFGASHHFRERPGIASTAVAIAKDWIDDE